MSDKASGWTATEFKTKHLCILLVVNKTDCMSGLWMWITCVWHAKRSVVVPI